ncbi:Protein CBR-INS-17 [Caenorhabditis briggsae]|uniref:Protein CBR-INS-17 n=1 Tax=Caenorhabditis briggsae TaxID=6238 RepID=A8XSX7_CAEBR|nr:Protein CBR-INS-17 [Caenorhabditis briggsae]CAP35580.1 Protein CBR-INS-17 [Caenorhabditis briggsae]
MVSTRGVLLLLSLMAAVAAFGLFSRPAPITRDTIRPPRTKQGSLKLFPQRTNIHFNNTLPGGASFLDAFNLICPMRRRRRSVSENYNDGTGSLLGRTMNHCCENGCEFTDIFAICNPFG